VVIFYALIFSFASAQNGEAYNDKNGYFSFVPPEGWLLQDLSKEYQSKAIFVSSDGAAMIILMAGLDDDNLGSLFLLKKDLAQELQQQHPDGTFDVNKSAICGFTAVSMDFEIPNVAKKEFYFFYFDGVRFDLTYSVAKEEDFQKYRNIAIESFSTFKPKRRVFKRY
jgi:hypothetical protein